MREKKRLKAIIFDMDGVLLDSLDWMRKAEKYALSKYGIKFDERRYAKISGMPIVKIYQMIAPKIDTWEIIGVQRAWQAKNMKMVRPFPKVRFVLRELNKRYLVALCTGRRKFFGVKHLKMYDLNKYFRTKVFADDVKKGKPHPEGLMMVMKKLNVKPTETVYVGDALPDVGAARAAKVAIIGALYGIDGRLIKGKTDYEIKKLEDVLKVLERIDPK